MGAFCIGGPCKTECRPLAAPRMLPDATVFYHSATAGDAHPPVCPGVVVAFVVSVACFCLGIFVAAAQCEEKHCSCPPLTPLVIRDAVSAIVP